MQHKILNNDYENVLKKFKMNIHATFICLHLKLMGMKTNTLLLWVFSRVIIIFVIKGEITRFEGYYPCWIN